MNPEIKIGSLSMSQSSEFVNSLVNVMEEDDMEYRPFSSIVEGFDLRLLLDF